MALGHEIFHLWTSYFYNINVLASLATYNYSLRVLDVYGHRLFVYQPGIARFLHFFFFFSWRRSLLEIDCTPGPRSTLASGWPPSTWPGRRTTRTSTMRRSCEPKDTVRQLACMLYTHAQPTSLTCMYRSCEPKDTVRQLACMLYIHMHSQLACMYRSCEPKAN